MAWTAPMTFTANTALTAAQLNLHLRDNLMETETAKASVATSHFVTVAPNQIAQRTAKTSRVATAETSTSTDYTDLATAGPAVTCTTGSMAYVFHSATMFNSSASTHMWQSWELTGDTEREAQDVTCISMALTANGHQRFGTVDLLTTLNPGTTTFTLKYKVAAGTGSWADRFICVFPL